MFLKSPLWLSVLVLFALLGAPNVHAQTAAPARGSDGVAFLNKDVVYGQAKAMKNIHEQFAKYQAALQKGLESDKEALQADEEALNRQRTIIGPEAYAEKRKAFQSRIVDFQRTAQERSLKLNQVRAKATAEVELVVRDVLKEIVEKNGIIVVFDTKQTIYVNAALDITEAVLTELDKRLPSVQVTDPTK